MASDKKACCAALQRWLSPDLFRALSDPSRVALLVELAAAGGERTVSQLHGRCRVDLSVVSRHLRTLREAGIVEASKRGKEVFYRVRFDGLVKRLRELASALEACCVQPVAGGGARVRQGGAT